MTKSLHVVNLVVLILLTACRYSPANDEVLLSADQRILLLDSSRAAQAIIQDSTDGFFAKIQVLDMSIQMKRNYAEQQDRPSVLADYLTSLQEDVMDFSPRETALLTGVWQELYPWVTALSTDIFPPQIELIKVRGRHYGPGVYYTRENRIIIPQGEIHAQNRETLLRVMLHELFHIYSRYHPAQRKALYSLIDFYPLAINHRDLLSGSFLEDRLLLNPDGTDMGYAQRVSWSGVDSTWVVPLLWSSEGAYLPEQPSFFSYVTFDLYELAATNGRYRLLTRPDGSSTVPTAVPRERDDYNTSYVIHPDEILADNFATLILQRSGNVLYAAERYTPAGQALLRRIEAVLK